MCAHTDSFPGSDFGKPVVLAVCVCSDFLYCDLLISGGMSSCPTQALSAFPFGQLALRMFLGRRSSIEMCHSHSWIDPLHILTHVSPGFVSVLNEGLNMTKNGEVHLGTKEPQNSAAKQEASRHLLAPFVLQRMTTTQRYKAFTEITGVSPNTRRIYRTYIYFIFLENNAVFLFLQWFSLTWQVMRVNNGGVKSVHYRGYASQHQLHLPCIAN